MTRRRTRATAAAVVAAVAVVTWLLLRPLGVHDPRLEVAAAFPPPREVPRVVRYVPERGGVAFGLVLEAERGMPRRILSLSALDPRLGSSLVSFAAKGGFELAARLVATAPSSLPSATLDELTESQLSTRLLSPVDISAEQLERGERLVVAMGLNYASHREETDRDTDVLLFAKHAAATGAYADVPVGTAPDGSARALVDYEVELGFVLLEDTDLSRLPASEAELQQKVAFAIVNDVSDRVPIIADPDRGYTAGKSEPGWLPVGPWLVHGRHLPVGARGWPDLELGLSVVDSRGEAVRQRASSADLLRGPLQILREIAELRDDAMVDRAGTRRPTYVERGSGRSLPAGSLVITGTPRGTAIEAPTGADFVALAVRAGFRPAAARAAWARHCELHRRAMGFLSPGDVVAAEIQDLGRQRFRVVP